MKTRVWFKLGQYETSFVDVDPTVMIKGLKFAIKESCHDELEGISAMSLRIFSIEDSSNFKEADEPVPENTTPRSPIFVAPNESIMQEGDHREPRIKRLKRSLPLEMLNSPANVIPFSVNFPKSFISSGEFDDIETMILHDFQSSGSQVEHDDDSGFYRVPPMALVRCSRGGKTRALAEIAKRIRNSGMADCVIFVTFNDWSSIDPQEQQDPLGALCQRIAFSASKGFKPRQEAYNAFLFKDFIVNPNDIVHWLGDVSAVLLVDELNNLEELTTKGSPRARDFGKFVKQHFLDKEERYFIFSSHVLDTLEFFAHYIDPSGGSIRPVVLQDLPMVTDLSFAVQLKKNLAGAREAIYYGLMPAMIFERAMSRPIGGKREIAVDKYLEMSAEKTRKADFKGILSSLITGELRSIPKPLHILLDAYFDTDGDDGRMSGLRKIRWIPYHFEYLMSCLQVAFPTSPTYRNLAGELETLCSQLRTFKESPGDGWEALFVLCLLARCIAPLPQKPEREPSSNADVIGGESLVPRHWFDKCPRVLFNGSYSSSKSISSCTTWKDIKSGLDLDDQPQISIFYPPHARFEVYDVITVYSENKKIVELYGYQCKEGKVNSGRDVEPDFTRSFVLKGDSPPKSSVRKNWLIASAEHVRDFFGSSGKHWTPREWRRLSNSLPRDTAGAAETNL